MYVSEVTRPCTRLAWKLSLCLNKKCPIPRHDHRQLVYWTRKSPIGHMGQLTPAWIDCSNPPVWPSAMVAMCKEQENCSFFWHGTLVAQRLTQCLGLRPPILLSIEWLICFPGQYLMIRFSGLKGKVACKSMLFQLWEPGDQQEPPALGSSTFSDARNAFRTI